VSNKPCQVRRAEAGDAAAVAGLAAGLAQSFEFSRDAFGLSYPALLADADACLLLAVDGEVDERGCLLMNVTTRHSRTKSSHIRRGALAYPHVETCAFVTVVLALGVGTRDHV
jgi:hypothetical protein